MSALFPFDTLAVVYGAGAFVLLATLFVLWKKPASMGGKVFFFSIIALPALFGTFYIAGETFYEVRTSPTGGPVHWHLDFRIFNCGEEVDLLDPSGLSNRIGTPILHEHGDKRIHVEGTPRSLDEVSLGAFFEVIGGSLSEDELRIPTNMGTVALKNGGTCPDGAPGVLQAFVWKMEGDTAVERKLGDFPAYVMSPEELVPPGDCVIFEFGPEKERTEYICEQYEVAESRSDIAIER